MAKSKKFFNRKVKKKPSFSIKSLVILAIIIILIIITVIFIIRIQNNNTKIESATIEMRDKVVVEIGSKEVDKTLFFTNLENVKESDIKVSYSKVNFNKVGTYEVTLKIYSKEYKSTLEVIDTTSPELTVKNVTITEGSTYKASDFVDSCIDNSNEDCIIEFYDSSLDQDGNKIDYSNYKDKGTYSIQIIAKDASENSTSPVQTLLTVGETTAQVKPTNCKYGNNEYDNSSILSIDVTENGCALDLNLYKSETLLASVNSLIKAEQEKLQKEFTTLNLGVNDIYLNSSIDTVLNTSGNGIVGYTINMELSIMNNGNKELIESYTLKKDGSRAYSINKYNLK